MKLNNGIEMPQLGFGVGGSFDKPRTEELVGEALKLGFKKVDTASKYGNEEPVGKAIKGLDVFVTTKVYNDEYKDVQAAFNRSFAKLGKIDLYIMHFPVTDTRLSAWKQMEEIYSAGKCKAIGVSNYMVPHLKELLANSSIVPAVNQVEFNPFLFNKELLDFCKSHGIILEAYGPLVRGQKFKHPVIAEMAKKYSKTPAQILLQWGIEHGISVITSASHPDRMKENLDIEFKISSEDMMKLDSLNENLHLFWDPTNTP